MPGDAIMAVVDVDNGIWASCLQQLLSFDCATPQWQRALPILLAQVAALANLRALGFIEQNPSKLMFFQSDSATPKELPKETMQGLSIAAGQMACARKDQLPSALSATMGDTSSGVIMPVYNGNLTLGWLVAEIQHSDSVSAPGRTDILQSLALLLGFKLAGSTEKAALQQRLARQEILFRELRHRMKNNLQIISSLLDINKMRAQTPEAIDLLTDASAKVNAIAMVHRRLQNDDQAQRVDMNRHILELLDYLSGTVSPPSTRVRIQFEPCSVYLPVGQATPCTLVLNELLTNAYKHAFTAGQQGLIAVSLQQTQEDLIILSVRDNGVGIRLDAQGNAPRSMGLKLVTSLVQQQLRGQIRMEASAGTRCTVEFKANTDGQS